MRPHDPSDDLSPEQRFQQIAALLATGLRRLRPRTAFSSHSAGQTAAEKPLKTSPDCPQRLPGVSLKKAKEALIQYEAQSRTSRSDG
jgi:hypothetical protein